METFICSHCGQEHPSGTRFCPRTGLAIAMPSVCPACGKPIEMGWQVCAHCGQTLTTSYSDSTGTMMGQTGKSGTLGRISRYGVLALVLVVVVTVFGVLIFRGFTGNTVKQPPTSKPPASNLASPSVPTIPSNSQVNPTSVIEQQPQLTPFATSATATQCDGDKWTFAPIAVYRYPEGNGFDFTIVDIAVHNGSDRYWGSVALPFSNIYISSEGGFTYAPYNGWFDVPASPSSPYSGTRYDQYNRLSYGTALLPPGFTTLGVLGSGGFGGGDPHTVYRYTFGFEVASSQKSLTLNIKDIGTLCYDPRNPESFGDRFPILSYPLDNLTDYKLPTEIDYPELGSQPIVVPDKGTFEYKGYTKHQGFYLLNFSFTNASAGYNVKGTFNTYLVGDDGVFRHPDDDGAISDCPFFLLNYDAGPAQTVTLCPIPFKIPAGVHNLKFVFQDSDYFTNRAFSAFSFNPSAAESSSTTGLNATWQVEWTNPDGYLATGEMVLEVDQSNNIDGSIKWTWKKTPKAREQIIGLTGIEYISGTYDPQARSVVFQGYEKDDPNNVIGLDEYKLSLSADGSTLSGTSKNNGDWQGQLTATRKP
jgi:hypothetical protein